MSQYKNIILWAALSLSIMMFFWLNNKTETFDDFVDLALPDDPPDVFITAMNLTRFDTNGNIAMTTEADTLAVYEASGESLLTNAKVILSNASVATWQITAEHAVLHKNEDIEFSNNVVTLQLNDTPSTQINTEYMMVTNNGKLVKTDKAVFITKGKQSINAIGMEVKLDTIEPIIHLLSDVSFKYDPSK